MEPRLNVYVSFIPDEETGAGSGDAAAGSADGTDSARIAHGAERASRESGLKNGAEVPNKRGKARRRAAGTHGNDKQQQGN
jgi:hypothetical protein